MNKGSKPNSKNTRTVLISKMKKSSKKKPRRKMTRLKTEGRRIEEELQ